MFRQPRDCRQCHVTKWAAYSVSYTRKRRDDGAEIFTLKKQRHVEYWMVQAFPVLLVIRNSAGEVRWMEVRDWLKRESEDGKKAVKQIVFEGERFDVMSVRRWRDGFFPSSKSKRLSARREDGIHLCECRKASGKASARKSSGLSRLPGKPVAGRLITARTAAKPFRHEHRCRK